jgi:CBS domain-containing protein
MTLDTSDKGGGTLIVRDVMTENVFAVTAETPLKLVATRMLECGPCPPWHR